MIKCIDYIEFLLFFFVGSLLMSLFARKGDHFRLIFLFPSIGGISVAISDHFPLIKYRNF